MTSSPARHPSTLAHDNPSTALPDEVAVRMRTAVNTATSHAALKQALQMDRAGRRDPVLQAVRQRVLADLPENGVSDLARAAKQGAVASVRMLLEAGADPNHVQDEERLDSAVLNDLPVIDPRDPPLFVALQHAAYCSSDLALARRRAPKVLEMVDLLLNAGASVEARSKHQESLLHELMRLPGLWFDGVALRLAQRLIDAGMDPTMVHPHFKTTALHTLVAQREAPPEMVIGLVSMGVPVLARDHRGQTARDYAPTERQGSPNQTVLLETLDRLTQATLRQTFDELGTTTAPIVRGRARL